MNQTESTVSGATTIAASVIFHILRVACEIKPNFRGNVFEL